MKIENKMKQREIKFRAWDKGKMHYFDLSDTIFPSLEVEVMQFTGLKDKNGVEIYEGDIINFTFFTYSEYEVEVIKQGIITCDSLGFVFKELNEGGYYLSDLMFDSESDIEVIGNIHQNKHLLK